MKKQTRCKLFGHKWKLHREVPFGWHCKRCGGTLKVSQMNSFEQVPYARQEATGSYGKYHWA